MSGPERALLIEAREFIGAVAGENQPARSWAVKLRDDIDAALSAAPQPAPAVGVKPLVWTQKAPPAHDHEPFVYWAAGLGGHYRAERDGVLWMAHDAFIWHAFDNQEAAKTAAQADHETRVRAALSTPEE